MGMAGSCSDMIGGGGGGVDYSSNGRVSRRVSCDMKRCFKCSLLMTSRYKESCLKMMEGERSKDSGYSDIQENPT